MIPPPCANQPRSTGQQADRELLYAAILMGLVIVLTVAAAPLITS